MTPQQFTAWKTDMELSIPGAAKALGISESAVSIYLSGFYRGNRRGEEATIPKPIGLACAALAAGITEYVK